MPGFLKKLIVGEGEKREREKRFVAVGGREKREGNALTSIFFGDRWLCFHQLHSLSFTSPWAFSADSNHKSLLYRHGRRWIENGKERQGGFGERERVKEMMIRCGLEREGMDGLEQTKKIFLLKTSFLATSFPRSHHPSSLCLLLLPTTTPTKTTGGKLTHTPSFEDFSLGTAADAEEELSPKAAAASLAAAENEKKSAPPPSAPSQPLARASAPGGLSHSPPSTPSPTASASAANKLSSASASSLEESSAAAAKESSGGVGVTKQPSGATLWGSVFHPGRWGHRHEQGEPPLTLGTKYYDNAGEGDKTTWEEVVKSERLQTLAQLPRIDGNGGGNGGGSPGGGYVDAGQLRAALGPSEDVEQLIAAARDGRAPGDERVPFDVFANLLRNS